MNKTQKNQLARAYKAIQVIVNDPTVPQEVWLDVLAASERVAKHLEDV